MYRLGVVVLIGIAVGVVIGAVGGFALPRLGLADLTLPAVVGTVVGIVAGITNSYLRSGP